MATLSTLGLLLCSLLKSSPPSVTIQQPPYIIIPTRVQLESSPQPHNPRHYPLPKVTTNLYHHPNLAFIVIIVKRENKWPILQIQYFSPTIWPLEGRDPIMSCHSPPCLQDRKDIVNDDRMGNLNELITSSGVASLRLFVQHKRLPNNTWWATM